MLDRLVLSFGMLGVISIILGALLVGIVGAILESVVSLLHQLIRAVGVLMAECIHVAALYR